jgi:hypothetical protein
MAGRSDKPPSDRAVEDASSFMFEIDAATPAALGRAKPAPDKPHFHDHRARLRQRFDEAGPAALAAHGAKSFKSLGLL